MKKNHGNEGQSRLALSQGRALCKIANEYPTLYEVIMESVQNAIDAEATVIELLLNKKHRQIVVQDNGKGVTKEEFEVALMQVCESVKERGKLGQFGIGLISPLGKCKKFTFTSFAESRPRDGYNEWEFVTEDIREQSDQVVVPHHKRLDLVNLHVAPSGTRRDVTAVEWSTNITISSYTKDKLISRIPSADELFNGIVERYGSAMRNNNVEVRVAIVTEKGEHDLKSGMAKPFTGKKLAEAVVNHPDSGATTIRLYLARKSADKKYHGKVLVGEADNDFRFLFSVFARSAGILSAEMVEAFHSGIFEGEILTEGAKLNPNRKSFAENEALLGFCESIEEWYRSEGQKHVDSVREQREDMRYQELGEQSMRNLELLLRLPEYSDLLEVLGSFKQGTVGDDHTPPEAADIIGKQKEKSVAVNPENKSGTEGSINGHQLPSTERESHHPFTVQGPRGRQRTLVKSASLGLQFAHEAMEGSDRLYDFDRRRGIITFNIRHPVWVMCDRAGKGNRQIRQLQEMATIFALNHARMPDDWQGITDYFVVEILRPFALLISNSRSYNFGQAAPSVASQ